KENELIETNYETVGFAGAMLGITDPDGDGIFETVTGEPIEYTNFAPGFPEPGPSKVIVLKDGTWETVPYQIPIRRFIMEIPCVDFEILTPDIANDQFYETGFSGNVHYTAIDMCGNECDCDFELAITEDVVDRPCDAGGAFDEFYIKAFAFQRGGVNFTSYDGGYGDYYDFNMNIVKNSPRFRIKSGSNPDDIPLYWSIWIDWNKDGDYYDDQELIYQRIHPRGFDDQIVIPDFVDVGFTTTLRLSIAQYQWPEPCGFYFAGEVEDYTITIIEDQGGGNAQAPAIQGIFDSNDPDDAWVLAINEEEVIDRGQEEANWEVEDLTVFPNPATEQILVDVSSLQGIADMEIYDYQGRLVYANTTDLSQRRIPVDVSNLRNGLYVVSIRQEGSLVGSKTFIVQR
ncbi:MAG: GEVED domain-containing protein, partial [Bacteroidota bacterium]